MTPAIAACEKWELSLGLSDLKVEFACILGLRSKILGL
jgi:hypothetical protein